jgi:DNA polymerase-3 subunit alpha
MCRSFVHLHNHSEYSLLDGANRLGDMVRRAKDMEMSSIALTDHGVMFGIPKFYAEAISAGIKPILGVEAYVAPQGISFKKGDGEKSAYHLLLLAKNLEGYRNLCRLSSIAALEGFYGKPRVDHDLLRKYSAGVIATSACLGSEICQSLLKGETEKANYLAGMYAEIFGPDNFYIELQDHGLPEQLQIRDELIRIARTLRLPVIATNDAHYLCQGDDVTHDVLLCIQTGRQVDDKSRMRFEQPEFYLKSAEQMAALFADIPEALENTAELAAMCNVELDKQRAPMPEPQIPNGLSSSNYLRKIAAEGLVERVKDAEVARERLEYELSIIEATGFQDYFLLVKEFAEASRDRGIFFGVRGSAAGSLVSYCLGITDVNPIEYGLTFERFLNPERVSMPDVDMDFEDARRDEMIQYVIDRFGSDRVAQIATFGTMAAKAAIKDCGRALGWTPQDTDAITKLIPGGPGVTLDSALKDSPDLRRKLEDPRFAALFEQAKQVEGLTRNVGVHAAGVVISREPLVDYIPLYRGSDQQAITAYDMGVLEKMGMLKMDFLGLSNLTVLSRALKNIERTRHVRLDLQKIDLEDAKTFAILARGETTGVFQLESPGMTRSVMQLKPESVRELAAIIALYRPGPMENIPVFIDTKFGKREPEYYHPLLQPVLEETYGVVVYQDQVMQIVRTLAGFSLGKADLVRRAMSKKKVDDMNALYTEFSEGARERGVNSAVIERIWAALVKFAEYAFNKAHAVCYAILAYQTAYLKANYPLEYMAALLSVYLDKESKVAGCIEECRRLKIKVLAPDVNRSGGDFSVEGKSIRFGLTAIKGVGEGLVEMIVEERVTNGEFIHLYEFCARTKPYGMNRTALDALIRAGAFDAIDSNRNTLLRYAEGALQFADTAVRTRLAGQESLFEGDGEAAPQLSYPVLPSEPAPGRSDHLAMEKEVMGIYVSDHPLRGYEAVLPNYASHACGSVAEVKDRGEVRLAGVVARMEVRNRKSDNRQYANLLLEDFTGQAPCIVFAGTYDRLSSVLRKDALVQITGQVMFDERNEADFKVRVEGAREITDALPNLGPSNSGGRITITIFRATERQLRDLRLILEAHPGDYGCVVQIATDSAMVPLFLTHTVHPSDALISAIHAGLTKVVIDVQDELREVA